MLEAYLLLWIHKVLCRLWSYGAIVRVDCTTLSLILLSVTETVAVVWGFTRAGVVLVSDVIWTGLSTLLTVI